MKKIHAVVLAMGFVTGSANAANFSFTGNFEHNDEVQEVHFTVTAPVSDVTLRTWSSAGGINAAGATIDPNGFDPIVALFGASGNLIDQNDDTQGLDSFLMRNLPAGDYTATIAIW
ncbi:MAG: hypothetical protein K0S36_809 [Nitrosospira multiformis]|jgi:hypothetical protein|nr:hypothetical protein [Nitrosospira multiformis]